MKASDDVLRALAVTCEVMGMEVSRAGAAMMAHDLARFDARQVLRALERVRKEIRGRFTVGDIIERLEDARPGPEEAWAEIPRDEFGSIVWCEEQRDAWAACRMLIAERQIVQARSTFLEVYRRRVREARERGEPPRWTPSLGRDAGARTDALLRAVQAGRFSPQEAAKHLPAVHHAEPPPAVAALLAAAGIGAADTGEPRTIAPLIRGLLTDERGKRNASENGGASGGGKSCFEPEAAPSADAFAPGAAVAG